MTIKGIIKDGLIHPLEKTELKNNQEVLIYLPNDESDMIHQELYHQASKGKSFDFLNDPEEDIYSEHDLKVKYNN